MQALIDFDGWRKWEDFATANGLKDSRDPATGPKASITRKRAKEPKEAKSPAPLPTNNSTTTLAMAGANANLSASINSKLLSNAVPDLTASFNSNANSSPIKSSPTNAQDFETPVEKGIEETLTEDGRLKEDSPDTVVNVGSSPGLASGAN
jgi:hypothetical protein